MSSSKQLLPLRIPELSPSMGKLTSGTSAQRHWLPLDEIRIRLVTRLFESAGEARRLVSNDERAAALAALGSAAWQEAWDEAVTSTADVLLRRVTEHLEAEALAVKMGRRHRARLRIDDAEQRAVMVRLGAAGANLIQALDILELRAKGALGATALERDEVEAWQQQLKCTARQLEAAWISLEHALLDEEQRWRAVADAVARWRKPLWPVILAGGTALFVALWLGLVFGGYLAAPAWLETLWQAVGT